jgi:DNA-binding transcriptional ArsR family regulator
MAARLAVEAALQHPTRAAIVEAVQAAPGQGFRELGRRIGAAPGTLRHHLSVLSRSQVVREVSVGSRLVILPANDRRDPAMVALLVDPDLVALRDFVAGRGRVYQRQVMAEFPGPRSTIQNRLHRLVAAGALRSHRQGRIVFYEANTDGLRSPGPSV